MPFTCQHLRKTGDMWEYLSAWPSRFAMKTMDSRTRFTTTDHAPASEKKGTRQRGEGDAHMNGLQPGWRLRGTYHEACASEGHCPYYFGRDKEGGCRYFMVFRIEAGTANGIDLSGVVVVYCGDLPHSTYKEVVTKGAEGGIYVGSEATPQQREVLASLVTESLGGVLMKKNFGVKYVDIEVTQTPGRVHVRMAFGEMEQQLTTGPDGDPVRLENQTLPFLSNVKTSHTPYWNYEDHGRHFEYRNRCGTWADFAMEG